jgi:membrane-associated phospholipid phosphatase
VRSRLGAFALTVAAATCAVIAPAAAGEPFGGQPSTADYAYLGGVSALSLGLSFWPIDPHPPRGRTPAFDLAYRDAVAWAPVDRPFAMRGSDVLVSTLMLAAVAAPWLHQDSSADTDLAATTVAAQGLMTTVLLASIAKPSVARIRPDADLTRSRDAYASFFSGHTSSAFAAATSLTFTATEQRWRPAARWAVPVTAFTAAAATGYLRTAARRHWLTDVSVGALVGTGTTCLTYWMQP